MRYIFLIALAAASAVAQSVLDFTKLPECARQCVVLAQAEGGCVPPAAPVTTQQIYQSCVCQSALLTGLKSSGATCQATGCSADDAAKITTYYNALCAGPVVEPAPATTATTTTSAPATGTATAGAAGGTNRIKTTQGKTDWVSTHKGWLAFAIIFPLLFSFFLFGGLWLKKRHNRKRDAKRANMAAHDAPYNPPAPGAERSLPSILRNSTSKVNASASTVNGSTPTAPPPMPAMSDRSGNTLTDGGIGGIASPRGQSKLRSRSSTLQSFRLSSGSKANLPDPVAWGPHQHQAFYNDNHNASPSDSVPPSPTSAITPPYPVYRNREFVSSEPRFSRHRLSLNDVNNYSTPATPGGNFTPLNGTEIERPRTAGSAGKGTKPSEHAPTPPPRAINQIRSV